MVAITVILAAVIAAFVFGMGPPEQAPQASIRGSADTVGGFSVLKLEHQGGEAITLTDAKTKVTLDGAAVDLAEVAGDSQFDAGEALYIFNNTVDDKFYLGFRSNVTDAVDDDDVYSITATGTTSNVKIVDVGSQQMIADLKVNF